MQGSDAEPVLGTCHPSSAGFGLFLHRRSEPSESSQNAFDFRKGESMVKLGGRSGLRTRAVTTCGAALLCAALFGGNAWADPGVPPAPPANTAITSVQDLLAAQARVAELYRQAEQATERYNATTEQLGRTQIKVNDVNAGVVWARQNV